MKNIFVVLLLFLSTNVFANESLISINYEKPLNKIDINIKQDILDSNVNDDLINFIVETFKVSRKINIVYGYSDGPLYSSEDNTIYIPYRFIDNVTIKFENVVKEDIDEKVFDSLLHTLFHEIAHLFIFEYEIPVLGKEEDAADGLANILLLEYYDHGSQITQNAAELFLLESKEIKSLSKIDFWDEHSLDIQRYYSTMCYIYGSNSRKNSFIKKELKYDKYRSESCIEEYNILYDNWFFILKPFMKM